MCKKFLMVIAVVFLMFSGNVFSNCDEAVSNLAAEGFSNCRVIERAPEILKGPIITSLTIFSDGTTSAEQEVIGRVDDGYITVTKFTYVITCIIAGDKNGSTTLIMIGPQIAVTFEDAPPSMRQYGRFIIEMYFLETNKITRCLIK